MAKTHPLHFDAVKNSAAGATPLPHIRAGHEARRPPRRDALAPRLLKSDAILFDDDALGFQRRNHGIKRLSTRSFHSEKETPGVTGRAGL